MSHQSKKCRDKSCLREESATALTRYLESAVRYDLDRNLVALHLLKFCHYQQDKDGFQVELRYLRDRTGREVDFLVTIDRKPWFAVEAKLTEAAIDPSLVHFRERLKIPFVYQVVLQATRDFVQHEVRCLPAATFFSALN